jgi:hypothetical protein
MNHDSHSRYWVLYFDYFQQTTSSRKCLLKLSSSSTLELGTEKRNDHNPDCKILIDWDAGVDDECISMMSIPFDDTLIATIVYHGSKMCM